MQFGSSSGQETRPARPIHVQEGVYRADKILWHRDRMDALRRGDPISPVTVHFVISDLCNHDCGFCSFRMENNLQNALFGVEKNGKRNNNPSRRIPTEKCFELLEDFASMGVRGVEYTGGGEPTIHPDCGRIFRRGLDLGLDCSLVTNGQRIPESLDRMLLDFSWIRFSIDAAHEESYAHVRRISSRHFAQTLANARRLIDKRNRIGSDTTIGAGFVIWRENWREILDAVRLYKEIGFDAVRLGAIFNSSEKIEHFDGWADEAAALCAQAKREFEDDDFRVHDNFRARLDDLSDDGRPDYARCRYQELVAYVAGDQKLYRCCDTAYNPIGLLGDLETTRFRDLWSELYASGSFSEFQADEECEFCMFNTRNRLAEDFAESPGLAYPDGPPPPHGAFV